VGEAKWLQRMSVEVRIPSGHGGCGSSHLMQEAYCRFCAWYATTFCTCHSLMRKIVTASMHVLPSEIIFVTESSAY
jgi:hypothetical protein